MRILEVAKRLNISARAIRFYEEKGLITPDKQKDNQYRDFTEQHIWRLQTIIALRELGVSLSEIQRILDGIDQGDTAQLHHYLELQRNLMFGQWIELKQLIGTADVMIERLKEEQKLNVTEIYQLADGVKRIKDARRNWSDAWNFDRMALAYDEEMERGAVAHLRPFDVYRHYDGALGSVVQWVAPASGEFGLDLATGTGNLAARFIKHGARMAGVDSSREMLSRCARKLPEMEVKLGNLLTIPYFDHKFDFVVSSFAFHLLTDDQKTLALEEMTRVLKPQGRLCMVDCMFENDDAREAYLEQLEQAGNCELAAMVKGKHFADRSKVLHWLRSHGYVTVQQQIDGLIHIIYGVRVGASSH